MTSTLKVRRFVGPLAGALMLAGSCWAQEGMEFRVYNVSDLMPESARTTERTLPPTPGVMQVTPTRARVVLDPAAIAFELAVAMGLDAGPIGPWLIGLNAEPDGHRAFAAAIDAVHEAYRPSLGVRLAVYAVDAASAPTPGMRVNPAAWGTPVREIRQIVRRRTPTQFASVTSHTYASDVNVIVGTGGFGYEPQTARVDEGVELVISVGAARGDGLSRIEAEGMISRVALRQMEMQGLIGLGGENMPGVKGAGEARGPFELPTVDRRPIRSVVDAAAGQETALAVVDEPGSTRRLVVTIRLDGVE